MATHRERVTFQNDRELTLSGRLELPEGIPRAYGVFAHCFTCTKDISAAVRLCTALAEQGIAMLRFDFSGIGESEGDFCHSNFTTNVADIQSACDFLKKNHGTPQILIGHSLGGTAVLWSWQNLPFIRGLVTLNSPSEPRHVTRVLEQARMEILTTGQASVTIGGNSFVFTRQFIEDLDRYPLEQLLQGHHPALLVMHAPSDQTVGVENAGKIFAHATHPKSFVSLDKANHLITEKSDTTYIAQVISAWIGRYLTETVLL